MDKFLIKYSRNETSTATVSVPVSVSDEDDEPKAKKKGPVEANKTKSQQRKDVQVRKFQSKWLEGRSWLKHDVERNVMICKYCEQFDKQKQSSLSQGSSTFKVETLRKHEVSEIHLSCQKAYAASLSPAGSTPIEKGFQKMDEIELERRKKQFTTAFFVAKEERPLTDFPKLLELQKANSGEDLTQHYGNNKQCKTFVHFVAESEREEFHRMVRQSSFCSVISDSSTDSSVAEEEGVYVRFLNQDYIPVTRFLSMHKLEKPDAPHTKQAIICALEKASIDWKNSSVNFTADGASVNFRCRTSVFKLLQKDLNHLISIHCSGHRLELALKDAAKQIPCINTLEELLQSLYKFYHNSANM